VKIKELFVETWDIFRREKALGSFGAVSGIFGFITGFFGVSIGFLLGGLGVLFPMLFEDPGALPPGIEQSLWNLWNWFTGLPPLAYGAAVVTAGVILILLQLVGSLVSSFTLSGALSAG
jgi:hypothetical protein